MLIKPIHAGLFKLDGGAMYGVVPRQLWQHLNPPDDNNMCTWAMRCLLVDTGSRVILIDTGMGDKQGEKFRKHFEPHGDMSLINSLAEAGYTPEQVTDVLLTHLHFDHCGGAVKYDERGEAVPTFPNATYWTNEAHYDWAYDPNMRERASFLHENFVPLREHGVLRFIDQKQDVEWIEGIRIRFSYGHTEAMMSPIIPVGDRHLVYCADLMPSAGHIRMPYVMSYDIRPLETLKDRQALYRDALAQDWTLFLEHDPEHECAVLHRDAKGRYSAGETFDLASFMAG